MELVPMRFIHMDENCKSVSVVLCIPERIHDCFEKNGGLQSNLCKAVLRHESHLKAVLAYEKHEVEDGR